MNLKCGTGVPCQVRLLLEFWSASAWHAWLINTSDCVQTFVKLCLNKTALWCSDLAKSTEVNSWLDCWIPTYVLIICVPYTTAVICAHRSIVCFASGFSLFWHNNLPRFGQKPLSSTQFNIFGNFFIFFTINNVCPAWPLVKGKLIFDEVAKSYVLLCMVGNGSFHYLTNALIFGNHWKPLLRQSW